ncbi:MAG: ribokinase [Armatimonadetes bacterium]|nr:ribokinase [Armatimonadota bacterium]
MVVTAPKIPAPGETIMGGEFLMVAGGKGANQAVAAARLGARVTFVGCVGSDMFGRAGIANLEAEGIVTSGVIEDADTASGVALIAVDPNGQNAIVVAPGANMRLSAEHVAAAEGALDAADCLVLQCEVPIETVAFAIERARRRRKPVILNPAPACALPEGLLAGVTCVTPNESEAQGLTGVSVVGRAGAERAAQALVNMGAASVVITLGSDGALVAVRDRGELIRAEPVRAVDATAAGDCFTAALAVALCRDWQTTGDGMRWESLDRAARYASAAAAVSVTRLGAQPSLPTAAEVQAFIADRDARSPCMQGGGPDAGLQSHAGGGPA